jgi:hypothetical protein
VIGDTKMNHIELYEQLINDPNMGYELKSLIRQFYGMELSKAKDAIILIGQLVNSKGMDKDKL